MWYNLRVDYEQSERCVSMIISEDMTNPDLYIDVINIKKELIFVAIECALLLILAWIFIKALQKYKELEADET